MKTLQEIPCFHRINININYNFAKFSPCHAMEILKNAPLTEAVCEILFMPTATFDNTLPGVLYTELKSEFPVKRERPANIVSAPNLENERAIDLTAIAVSQFLSTDNSQAVQIGKDLLVNNMIKPYKGWESFRTQILKVLKIYAENFSEPPQIRRVTLKYINALTFDKNEDYTNVFNFKLPNPPLPKYKDNRAFNTTVEYDTEYNDILSLSFRSVFPPDNAKKSVIIEINTHQIIPVTVELDTFEKWLNCAHKSIEDLFVASFKKVFFQKFK